MSTLCHKVINNNNINVRLEDKLISIDSLVDADNKYWITNWNKVIRNNRNSFNS